MTLDEGFHPRCPTCDMLVDVNASRKQLPFCSDRCRLIDLGRWLKEEHTLPCEADDEESEQEHQSSGPRLPPGWHDA